MRDAVEQARPLLETRAEVYDLLRRTFIKEPTPDNIKYLNEYDFKIFPFACESEEIYKGSNLVLSYLKKFGKVSDNEYDEKNRQVWDDLCIYDDLSRDYTHLFIGPHRLPAVPWESAYRNEDRLIFQEETLQVRRAYLKYQFLPLRYKQEADDHIGLELDFMLRLSVLTLNSSKDKTEEIDAEDDKKIQMRDLLIDQKQFLEEHLLMWVPSLSQDIINSAYTEFYQGMAYILNGFLKLDLEAINELLGIEQLTYVVN